MRWRRARSFAANTRARSSDVPRGRRAGVRRRAESRRRAEQPRGKQQVLQPRRRDRRARLVPGGAPAAHRALAKALDAGRRVRVAREPGGERRQRLGHEHVPVAGLAEERREPFDLGDHRVEQRVGRERRRSARGRSAAASCRLASGESTRDRRRPGAPAHSRRSGAGIRARSPRALRRWSHRRRAPPSPRAPARRPRTAARGARRSRARPWIRSSPRAAGPRPAPPPGETDWLRRRCASSISTSAMGARRARPPRTARISPRSTQSCASGSVRKLEIDRPPFEIGGAAGDESAVLGRLRDELLPRRGRESRRVDLGTRQRPLVFGSRMEAGARAACGGPLSVWTQRRPMRRTRSATPSRCSRKSGESK